MFGFSAILLSILILGFVTWRQTVQINHKTTAMFNTSLQVRAAIGKLESAILTIRLGAGNRMIAKNNQQKLAASQLIGIAEKDALRQFDFLKDQYPGQPTDIEESEKSFINWLISLKESAAAGSADTDQQADGSFHSINELNGFLEQLLTRLKKIDNFASDNTTAIKADSAQLSAAVNRKLLLLTTLIIAISLLISYFLSRAVRQPVRQLEDAASRFKNRRKNESCSYQSKNEFGIIAESFNSMAVEIQNTRDLNDRVATLGALMLSEYDPMKFFRVTLNTLLEYTGSQMIAVFLLSKDKKTYDHFESIGLSRSGRGSFDAICYEGELGAVLSSGKLQHIKNISENTRYTYHTVSGRFIPREIITLPVLTDNEVIAVLSLFTINNYSEQSLKLIDRISNLFCARVGGILALQKIRESLQNRESTNELPEDQQTELQPQPVVATMAIEAAENRKRGIIELSHLTDKSLQNIKLSRTGETADLIQSTSLNHDKPVVLVVEKNADNRIAVKSLLTNDYIVLEAIDSISGIKMARKHRPNLILMDMALPGTDDIEAFKRIHSNGKLHQIYIIALISNLKTSDSETILSRGADAFIAKPIDEKLFFKTINSVLYGEIDRE